MIMPRGEQLLLPVNPFFIWFSLIAALLLNMLPFGQVAWLPDLVALVLIFWAVHQSERVGLGAAFVFGLVMDVYQSAMLGQHALAYCIVVFIAMTISRRLVWYSLVAQAFQLLPLFALAHGVMLSVRIAAGAAFPDQSLAFAPLIEAALWPVVSVVLHAPQRRAPDRDAHRPL